MVAPRAHRAYLSQDARAHDSAHLTQAFPDPGMTLAVELWILILAHLCGCKLHCSSRLMGGTPRLPFWRSLASAIAYVAPAYPLLVVGANAVLLLATSLLRRLHIGETRVMWVVRWGGLFAPLWSIHTETVRLCTCDWEVLPLLAAPLTAAAKPTWSNNTVLGDLARLREHRRGAQAHRSPV